MLRVYDSEHNAIGYISNYKDLKIESDVSTGEKTMYFTLLEGSVTSTEILPEYYIQTQNDEYVVKERNLRSDGFPEYVASLNLEDLQQTRFSSFSVTDSTIEDAAKLALAGTGWTIAICTVTKQRNAGMMNVTPLEVIQKLCTAFMCEVEYDTKNKTVSFCQEVGNDRGVYFLRSLNLKKITKKSDTYDYYTRIIPTGKDGLTIADVNDGIEYLENFQYSSKILTYYWEDESYTDADALKEDAELLLEELSRPSDSYSAEILDLAKQSSQYSVLSFGLGDRIRLIDVRLGIREKQRIVKLTEYPDKPWENTCELGNAVLTFSELQEKYQAAAEIIDAVVSDDGRYKGTVSVSDILGFDEGVSSSSAVTSLSNSLATLALQVGEITTNYLTAEQAALKYATIENLEATDAVIKNLDTVYANIDFANIGDAAMASFYARSGLIKNVTVQDQTLTGELIGVTIKGDLIEADTIAAEKLIVKGDDGLYYRLNTDGATVTAEQTEYNSLNGAVIIAQSITADKISVSDLVAFGATIGGFHIGENSIYSGVKESVDNTTRGVYLDTDGQVAFGDSVSYVKYYADSSDVYHLQIAADDFTIISTSAKKSVKQALSEAVTDVAVEYALSDSATTAPTSGWSTTAPEWASGQYMWQRTSTTKDGTTTYSDTTCISGAAGEDAVMMSITASEGIVFKNGEGTTVLTAHVYIAGEEQEISDDGACGSLGSVKWYKGDDSSTDETPVGTGKTLTVTSDDVENYAVYTCTLED